MEEDKITLTPYEKIRTPQPLIIDPNRKLAVSPRALRPLFMCSICLDVLKNTMITKECMHRFCYECIITALRSGNKECPNCRMKLVSKRSLRADKSFDEIIGKIYPNREEYATQTYISASKNTRSFSSLHDMHHHKDKTKKIDDDDTEDEDDIPPEPSDEEIELIVKPMPTNANKGELLNDIRYMMTKKWSHIAHIAEYLQIRYNMLKAGQENGDNEQGNDSTRNNNINSCSNNSNNNLLKSNENNKTTESTSNATIPFMLYIVAGPGQYNPLPPTMSLADVLEKYWKFNSPLELYYAYNVPTLTMNGSGKSNQKSW